MLSDVKVVEWGDFVSAPFCSKIFADLGATVIKVEPPGNIDPSHSYGPFPHDVPHPDRSGLFLYLNSNKLGITLDIENEKGREIFDELLQQADIFVENQPLARIEDLGLDYTTLSALNPGLIVTSISPFGRTGPYKDYRGYHINCCALGGLSCGLGFPDREPIVAPISFYDYQAGLNGAAATLAALLARDMTCRGQFIDISESEVVSKYVDIMSYTLQAFFSETEIKREGRRIPHSLGMYPQSLFQCKDGYITAVCRSRQEWLRYIEAMGNPEWGQNPRYQDPVAICSYADEVDALLAPWLMEHTREEIQNIAKEFRIAVAPVRRVDEVLNDPHFRMRNCFTEVESEDLGRIGFPAPPYRFSRAPNKMPGMAPKLGQDNERVYCEFLGYSREKLVGLRRAGVI